MSNYEVCCKCGAATGRAGRADDSIYIEYNGDEIGPLCEDCYKPFQEIDDLKAELAIEKEAHSQTASAECLNREKAELWDALPDTIYFDTAVGAWIVPINFHSAGFEAALKATKEGNDLKH